jgi:hypothetical protein
MVRHLLAEAETDIDPESGLLHAAHAAWSALARLELMLMDPNGTRYARPAVERVVHSDPEGQ